MMLRTRLRCSSEISPRAYDICAAAPLISGDNFAQDDKAYT